MDLKKASANPLAFWMAHWNLEPDGESFTTKGGSHLAPVLFEGRKAMLKLAGGREESRGAILLQWWRGEGAPEVFARKGKAVLMERLECSENLEAMALGDRDAEATAILCAVVGQLHAPRPRRSPASLVPLRRWFGALERAADDRGGVFARAWAARCTLAGAPPETAVLHGDVHHGNVLWGGARGWLAIDPKGLLGDRAFDYANLLCNPWGPKAVSRERLEVRLAVIALEGRISRERMALNLLAWAGLSAAWTMDDGEDASHALAMARLAEAALAS
ncbi:MAG: aminoglycoside phosphotransferase family protein [Caulobacteraceae bacterium]